MRSGLVSVTFRALDVDAIVRLTAEAGLEGVEWGGDLHVPHGAVEVARRVARSTREHGLSVVSYGSYYRLGDDPETGGPAWKDVLACARELEAPSLRVWAGRQGSATLTPERRDRVVRDAAEKAEQAARAGILLTVEYHGDTLTDTNESTARLLAEVQHPNLLSLWQPRVGAEDGERLSGLRALEGRLAHLHVFHWTAREDGALERRPLAEGEAAWSGWLAEADQQSGTLRGRRWALLEFVRADAPEQLVHDASALRRMLPA